MANDKKSFILYCDIIHTVNKLSDEQSGRLFKHIMSYVNDQNPDANDIIIDLVFEPIKQSLKRDLIRYENICNRNKNNGKNGGRPKKEPKKPNGLNGNPNNPDKPKKPDSDSDSDSDSDIEKRKKIYIPEFSEFKEYAIQNQNNTDLHKLDLKYKAWVSSGWADGNGKKITVWKTKLLNSLPYMQDLNIRNPNERPKLAVR
jgi:hypothetical protein